MPAKEKERLALLVKLLVPDALLDPRFHDNPAMTGETHVRFYAGAPLTCGDGPALGTLCLVGTVPRTLDAVERGILESLRELVVLELTSHAAVSDE